NNILPLYKYAFSHGVVSNLEVNKMKKLFKLHKQNRINFYYTRKMEKNNKKHKRLNKIKNNYYLKPMIYNLRRKVHKNRSKKKNNSLNKYLNLDIRSNQIIMLGFDYSYRGNSKYLFDYLKTIYNPDFLKFVSFDKRVPEEYRLSPRSKEFYNYFYTSETVIGESWIPGGFKKKKGQRWI